MKKILAFIVLGVVITALTVFGSHLLEENKIAEQMQRAADQNIVVMASGTYIEPKADNTCLLEEKLIRVLKGVDAGDVTEAKYLAVYLTLQGLELDQWQNLSNLSSNYIFNNVHPAEGEELILSISAGKDSGVVAVFANSPQGYQLVGALTNLVPVTHLGAFTLPGLDYRALVVAESLDEMSGAFFQVKTKSLYLFQGNTLGKIWEREKYRREYWPAGNELKGNKTRWMKREEEAAIVFLPGGKIMVNGLETESRSKNPGKMNGEYEVTKKRIIKEFYAWDPDKASFRKK